MKTIVKEIGGDSPGRFRTCTNQGTLDKILRNLVLKRFRSVKSIGLRVKDEVIGIKECYVEVGENEIVFAEIKEIDVSENTSEW